MRLSDIIGRVLDLVTINGRVDTNHGIKTALPLVLASPDATDEAVRDSLSRKLSQIATRGTRRVTEHSSQGDFFGDALRPAYNLDVDGRVVKTTDSLTRLEFERLIAIREKQLTDDTAHLAVLKRARAELSTIWDQNPDATYGEVERMFLATRRPDSAVA